MNNKTTITIKVDKDSAKMLKDFVSQYTDLSVSQFVIDAVAEKLENDGEHFFWGEHSNRYAKWKPTYVFILITSQAGRLYVLFSLKLSARFLNK